ncbi:uncharacterized protein VTP21DRAFT_3301 [Calcarisporiella thermophila]|uniref:uncharacterized protein n=1 Tax=Calcarisporiella thermophila TaxID=911321 RepID=UPI003742855F
MTSERRENRLPDAGSVSAYRLYPEQQQSHGCPHLVSPKGKASRQKGIPPLIDAYAMVVRYSLACKFRNNREIREKNLRNGTNDTAGVKKRKRSGEPPFLQCVSCGDIMGLTHICLDCLYMGCSRRQHIQSHLSTTGHKFAVETSKGSLYCAECSDYIYDIEFEHVLLREAFNIDNRLNPVRDPSTKRSKQLEWKPNEDELKLLITNAQLAPCHGLRGLRNMGSTCFMNVILQSFIHNPLLRSHFLSDQHNYRLCQSKSNCMCCEMDKLFSQFYSGEKHPYGPCSFLHTMWLSSTELAGYAQQDAHEFFISALNQIHSSSPGSSNIDCQCIVHKTFSGLLQSDVTCLRCGNVTTVCDPMLDISLDFRTGVRRKKNGGTATPTDPNPGPNSLLDCLDRYTQSEKLGPNVYSCSKCNNTFQEAVKQLSIKRLPMVLSIQLKRYEHSASAFKIETMIRFPEVLDMTPYTTSAKRASMNGDANNKGSELRHIYRLFAVINHEGKMDTGHYTMFAKHRGEWFFIDDHKILLSSASYALNSKAYMCFYIRESLIYSTSHPLDQPQFVVDSLPSSPASDDSDS